MRPFVASVSGVGVSPVYPPDNYVSPFNLALSVLVTGTVTYTVQYTFDDVFSSGFSAASANWVDHPSLTTQTATKDSNIAYPVRGVRLNVTAGTGVARFTVIQAGGGGLA